MRLLKKIFIPFNIWLVLLIVIALVLLSISLIFEYNREAEFKNAETVKVKIIEKKEYGSKGYIVVSYKGKRYVEHHLSFTNKIGDVVKMKYSKKQDVLWSLGETPEKMIRLYILIALFWIINMIIFNYLNNTGKFQKKF